MRKPRSLEAEGGLRLSTDPLLAALQAAHGEQPQPQVQATVFVPVKPVVPKPIAAPTTVATEGSVRAQLRSIICRKTAKAFEIAFEELVGKSRERKFVSARQAAVYIMRLNYISTPMIGHFLSNRDHTTILHAYRMASLKVDSASAEYDDAFTKKVESLRLEIEQLLANG